MNEKKQTLKNRCKLLRFPDLGDERGKLVVIEGEKAIPFSIKRIFYMYGSGPDIVRGRHANINTDFILINVSGNSKIKITDTIETIEIPLCEPLTGVFIPRMLWKEMYGFSKDSVILVLASTHYDENEYIRDYSEYIKVLNNPSLEG